MTLYLLEATIDDEDLMAGVISAMMKAGIEIKLSPLTHAAKPESIGEIVHGLHPAPAPNTPPAPKPRAKRGNGGEWPAEGSIYSVVLKALESGEKTANELREALKTGGFSTGSLNSALGRLEKGGKAKKLDHGAWGAA
jgi:hypothetical protein